MVNKAIGTRYQVLLLLREQAQHSPDVPLSGEVIARETGVSRVSVWKAVHSLQENGYGIETVGGGYRLTQDCEDSLCPWEFGKDESLFHHWPVTDTTMKRARELAEKGAPDGTVVTADVQTAGRGTGDRAWSSAEGNLFFTIILRPKLPAARYQFARVCAQLALVDAVHEMAGAEVVPRWPNDVWIRNICSGSGMCSSSSSGSTHGDGKIAGMLTESSVSGDSLEWLTLGIGVNTAVRTDAPQAAAIAAQGQAVSRRNLLTSFIGAFGKVRSQDETDVINRWNSLCPDRGLRLGFFDRERTRRMEGVFAGIDENGFARYELEERTQLLVPGSGSFDKLSEPHI